jgi:hypothetical protein
MKLKLITNEKEIGRGVYYYEPIYLFTFVKTKNVWWAHAYDDKNYFEHMQNPIEIDQNERLYENTKIMGYNLSFYKEIEPNWYLCILNK